MAVVTIALATFNGEKYLGEQLASIESQTFTDWQLVVADDGSTDSTLSILRSFGLEHASKFVFLGSRSTGSAKANFSEVLRHLEPATRYVALCDQDDVWHPRKLELLVQSCRELERDSFHSLPAMVFSDLRVVDADGREISSSFFQYISARPDVATLGSCLVENYVPGCAMLFNAELLRIFRQGGDVTNEMRMHDWWLLLLAHCFGKVLALPAPLVAYRQHSHNAAGVRKRLRIARLIAQFRDGRRKEALLNSGQAAALLREHGSGMLIEHRRKVEAMASLADQPWHTRAKTYLRHGLLKQSRLRRVHQLLTW